MTARQVAAIGFVLLILAPALPAQRKKKPEKEITQVLELPRELPASVTADVERLSFHVSPLSAKGLLSQQVRDAVKALLRSVKGASLVKIRAFVAGSGDLRRVPIVVSEELTERRLALPSITVVQVGGLRLEGAQVVLEAIASEKKPVNPQGLAFISGQGDATGEGVAPLVKALAAAGSEAAKVKKVTCFSNSLDGADQLQTRVRTAFPSAVFQVVQLRRDSLGQFVECEAVAALNKAPASPLQLVEPQKGRFSQAALLAPGRVALTGAQLAFRMQDEDVRLAFGRLGKALEGARTQWKNVAMTSIYPLTNGTLEKVRKIRFEYYDAAKPPASTMLLFEGLPSLDAAFAIDVIATVDKS